ncbi:transposase [Streptomyces sp. Inha503]|uniref:transposase n=1 Tax=Streptomyces sp. Inha503 TaxID=3383314 RepID=UPI0039A27B6A
MDYGRVRRHELTDHEWELLAPLIPQAGTGRPRADDRRVVNGMVYKIRTGITWRDLPERYGSWKTVYTRLRRYALEGVFTHALQHQVPRLGLGRPRRRPSHVVADKAYSSQGFRAYLRKRGIGHTIPEKTDQQHRRKGGRRGGRPPGFDREIYCRRNIVERCFNALKNFCGIAYDRLRLSKM